MSKTRRDRRQSRHEAALERQAARAGRTNNEQIAMLDTMFGKGKGAAKERARLTALEKAASKKVKASKKKPKTTKTAKKTQDS